MVQQSTTFGSKDNPIDNSDVAAESVDLDVRREQSPDAILYRYINNTDVAVDITIEATDSSDESFSESEELRGSASGSEATLTVSANTVDSDLITEPWELLRFSIDFQSDPTSGQFVLREIHQS